MGKRRRKPERREKSNVEKKKFGRELSPPLANESTPALRYGSYKRESFCEFFMAEKFSSWLFAIADLCLEIYDINFYRHSTSSTYLNSPMSSFKLSFMSQRESRALTRQRSDDDAGRADDVVRFSLLVMISSKCHKENYCRNVRLEQENAYFVAASSSTMLCCEAKRVVS